MGAGLVLSLAASPPIAAKYHLEPFYFVRRQAAMLVPAIAIMFAASTLTPEADQAREPRHLRGRHRADGAHPRPSAPRSRAPSAGCSSASSRIQPSEFVKPAFVVLTAWLFNESQKRRDVPGIELAVALYAIFAVLLDPAARFRPDASRHAGLGRAVLHGRHQSGVDRRARRSPASAASSRPIFSCRMSPRASTASSIRPPATPIRPTARSNSFLHGGWFGRGPGEGTVKDVLPDSHTDFIFAVTAEEYGLIACLILRHSVRLHRAARSVQSLAGARRLHSPCHRRPHHAVRPAGAHQHGGECRVAPGQGHDVALHLLWRLLAARHGADHGLCCSG